MSILGTRSVILRRGAKADGSYVNGYWVDGATTDTTIQAAVIPMTPDMLERLEGGQRQKNPKLIISETELRLGDYIVDGAKSYQVVGLDDFSEFGFLSHYDAYAIEDN